MGTQRESIRVVVELDPASEWIRGVVLADDGEWRFDGWMQFTARLEDIRAAAAVPSSGESPEPGTEGP